jgi:hypothetical protein
MLKKLELRENMSVQYSGGKNVNVEDQKKRGEGKEEHGILDEKLTIKKKENYAEY